MSPGTLVILNLLGGVALLLWGVRMVRTGVLRAWGDWLKRYIEARLTSRLSAFAAGAGATLLLQSGTATALIITGVAASGMIAPASGLAVLLGADLGSSLVTAAFAVLGPMIAVVSPVLLFAGYVVHTASTEFRPRNAGRILLGLGLMLLALKLVVTATAPLQEATLFHEVLTSLGKEPLLAVLIGALATWVSYSTLSVVLLITTFLANGSLEIEAALALLLGVNLGGGLPALTATAGQPREARRLPIANLACRAALALVMIPYLPGVRGLLEEVAVDPVHGALAFHVGFNALLAVVCLPFASLIVQGVKRALPDVKQAVDWLAKPRYLDPTAFESPALALSNAQSETARMTELLDRMVEASLATLKDGNIEELKSLRSMDERINGYQTAIHGYLARLMGQELEPGVSQRIMEVMLYVSNLEHAGDIVHLNLADRIRAKVKEQVDFSTRQTAAINELGELVRTSLRIASGVLAVGEVAGARLLIEQKGAFRALENSTIEEHFSDRSKLGAKSLRTSALFVDIVRDLHRINSHIVSAAYPIADREGLLRDTRLRDTAVVAE